MTSRLFILFLFALLGCQQPAPPPSPVQDTVWAVDLVSTLPGQQENYIASIKSNWANARRIAKARSSVRSYRAFAAAKDSTRGWDVMLMTEYADSTAWSNREPIFEAIFASEEFVFVEPGSPPAEMRTFFVSDVAMKHFVNE
ncbi:MAG: hypothetical protein AAF564_20935 [Bacteroidota bacterium]